MSPEDVGLMDVRKKQPEVSKVREAQTGGKVRVVGHGMVP